MCTNAQHDPGGETKAPPSVWLEEESKVESSRHVEPTDVKMNDVDVEGHRDTQKEPRDPVGTTDGDERHPSVPTEPPNKEGAAKCLSGELRVKSTVERARESSRKVEGKRRSQSEGEDETSQLWKAGQPCSKEPWVTATRLLSLGTGSRETSGTAIFL
jgi:hypothetical protein